MPLSRKPRLWHRFTLAVAACSGLAAVPSIPMISIAGAALMFSGFSQQAIAANQWHVRATGGSDSGAGTSYADAYATIAKVATVAASGDTIYFSGIFRLSSGVTFTSLSNVTYAQEPGQTATDIRWETLTGTGWTDDGGGKWHKTLATGLGNGAGSSVMNGELLFQWNTTTDSLGRPTGHLKYVAGAGAVNQYDYNNATGRCDINVSGSPNGATTDVSYSVSTTAAVCITLAGGTGNLVSGLTFSLNCAMGTAPVATPIASYGLLITNNSGTRTVGCTFRDSFWHHAGYLNFVASAVPNAGNTFELCVFYGGYGNLGQSVFYADDAAVAVTGARWLSCTTYSHRYLNPLGVAITNTSLTTNTQVGAQAHGGAGAVVDLLASNCRFLESEWGWQPCSFANQPATSPTWTWSACPARTDTCTFAGDGVNQTGCSSMRNGANIAHRKPIIDIRNCGPSGMAHSSGPGAITQSAAGLFVLMDTPSIICTIDDGLGDGTGPSGPTSPDGSAVGESVLFNPYGAAAEIRLINPSIHDTSTPTPSFYRYVFGLAGRTDNFVRVRGGAISLASDFATNLLFGQDGGSSAGQHDLVDVAFYTRTATLSLLGTIDTPAKWLSAVDSTAKFVSGAMFPNVPTTLALNPTSSIYGLRRSSAAVLPSAGGINGPYTGYFGAYQYGATPAPPPFTIGGFFGRTSGGRARRVTRVRR